MRECYMLEVGVLLKKEDEEFEQYSQVYDKKHGYYDEYQEYVLKLENAKKKADSYVKEGVAGTYAIISQTYILDDVLDDAIRLCPVENESYALEDVVYAIHKENDLIVPLF